MATRIQTMRSLSFPRRLSALRRSAYPPAAGGMPHRTAARRVLSSWKLRPGDTGGLDQPGNDPALLGRDRLCDELDGRVDAVPPAALPRRPAARAGRAGPLGAAQGP